MRISDWSSDVCSSDLGSPEEYKENLLHVKVGEEINQRKVLRKLVDMQYERNDMNLVRGKFRVRGDTIEIHPAYDERSEEHTSELQSLMRISYAVFCLKKKKKLQKKKQK